MRLLIKFSQRGQSGKLQNQRRISSHSSSIMTARRPKKAFGVKYIFFEVQVKDVVGYYTELVERSLNKSLLGM
jgi:translation elongation factor EF-1beta